MRFLLVLISIVHICAATVARAQDSALSQPDLSASGAAYQKAVRYRGIDTDVVYFDPTQPAPPLDTEFTPKKDDAPETDPSEGDSEGLIVAGISALVLVFIFTLVYFGAGRASVSFRSAGENARRKPGQSPEDQMPDANRLPDLDALLRSGNRDLAVVGLAQMALTRCLAANEVLFKRSWTHREALRSLPQSLWYMPDLRALVLASERVNFGHRSISQTDFDALVARVRPILREVPA